MRLAANDVDESLVFCDSPVTGLDPVLQRITNFHRPVNSAVRPELAEVVHPPSISSLHSNCACTLCPFRDGREPVSEMFNSVQPTESRETTKVTAFQEAEMRNVRLFDNRPVKTGTQSNLIISRIGFVTERRS